MILLSSNKVPCKPSDEVFAWDLKSAKWQVLNSLDSPSMEHRGLIEINDKLYIIGGMGEKQLVSGAVIVYQL